MNNRSTASRLRKLVLAAGLLCAPYAFGQSDRPFTFHWSVTTDENEVKWRSKVDWAQRVEFDQAPIRKDIYIFYGQFLGNYPLYGLHQIYITPNGLEEHLRRVRVDVEERLPADYDGLVCIDYENWNLIWDRVSNAPNPGAGPNEADYDYRDDWKDYLKATRSDWSTLTTSQQEALAKSTYDAATKEFITQTMQLCKQLRPRAKWGIFDYPNALYGGGEVPFGTVGYPPDGSGHSSKLNDQLQWLWDIQDVLFPTIYCMAATVPDSERADWSKGTDTVAANRQYVSSNVREAVRLAKGKPVIAYMWPRYLRPDKPWHETWINDINLRHAIEIPVEAGADGIAIWDGVAKPEEFQPLQDYTRQKLAPTIVSVITAHGLTQPGAGGGGGGSGGGGGGGGSAGGTQPPPTKLGNGVLSNAAFVPAKPSSGTGGWVPPNPGAGGSNNNNNTKGGSGGAGSGGGGGSGGGFGALMSKPQTYRVVGSAGQAKPATPAKASSPVADAARKPAVAQSSVPSQRQAALDAIKRIKSSKGGSGGSALSSAADRN